MTLEEYFNVEFDEGKIDFSVRVSGIGTAFVDLYIHPTGKDGRTMDFRVAGNQLERINIPEIEKHST